MELAGRLQASAGKQRMGHLSTSEDNSEQLYSLPFSGGEQYIYVWIEQFDRSTHVMNYKVFSIFGKQPFPCIQTCVIVPFCDAGRQTVAATNH